MSEHTPGPWYASDDTRLDFGECVLAMQVWSHDVRIAFTERQNVGAEQDAANASLIASAPDLLEACKAALSCCESVEGDMHAAEMLRAAIAKAEGREVGA